MEMAVAKSFSLLQVRIHPVRHQMFDLLCKASERSQSFETDQLIARRLKQVRRQLPREKWEQMLRGEMGREELKDLMGRKLPVHEPEVQASLDETMQEAAQRFPRIVQERDQLKQQLIDAVVRAEAAELRAVAAETCARQLLLERAIAPVLVESEGSAA
jgi:hypothetical protein